MTDRTPIDVARIIERQKLSGFLVGLVVISWCITFFDGLDSNLISFAAPYFGKDYDLTTKQLGSIFSIHQIGTLLGGFLLGYIGDRIGRRPTIIWATAGFGVMTLCFTFAASFSTLFGLRLINGIPLGGMLPLAWALNIEYAPKRYRSTIVTLIMIGYSLGTALGGPIANKLIPTFGWRSVFLFGGAASLLSAGILLMMLPESIRFLVSKGKSFDTIASAIHKLSPSQAIPLHATFVLADEAPKIKDFRPAFLFKGELRVITPLIWIGYTASSFAVFFVVNWTPLVFEALRYSRSEAATVASVNSLMGALGGLLLMRFTDHRGSIAIAVMPVIATALLLIAGLADMSHAEFRVLMALIGGSLIGGQFGMHSICGIFYPSAYRGNGAGWATSVAKIGSIAGPYVGGIALGTNLPVRHIFALLAVCPAIFAVCIYMVGRMHSRILGREALAAPEDVKMASVVIAQNAS